MTGLERISRITLGVFLFELVILCLAASHFLINLETMILLSIFDLLFVSLAFQLNGTLIQKLLLLALGNGLGLFCNFVFISFNIVGEEYFGQISNVFYAFFYPILNVLWIVTFWSLSLTALPKPTNWERAKRN